MSYVFYTSGGIYVWFKFGILWSDMYGFCKSSVFMFIFNKKKLHAFRDIVDSNPTLMKNRVQYHSIPFVTGWDCWIVWSIRQENTFYLCEVWESNEINSNSFYVQIEKLSALDAFSVLIFNAFHFGHDIGKRWKGGQKKDTKFLQKVYIAKSRVVYS